MKPVNPIHRLNMPHTNVLGENCPRNSVGSFFLHLFAITDPLRVAKSARSPMARNLRESRARHALSVWFSPNIYVRLFWTLNLTFVRGSGAEVDYRKRSILGIVITQRRIRSNTL